MLEDQIEEEVSRLRSLLEALGPIPLAERLRRCGELRGFSDNPYRFRCNQPACPRCRRRYARRRTEHLIEEFAHAPNTQMASFSIVMGGSQDVGEVLSRFSNVRQALRNSARWPGWGRMRAFGAVQVSASEHIWTPTLHGIAHLPRLDYQQFRHGLVALWPDEGRVEVKQFDLDVPLPVSLATHATRQLGPPCTGPVNSAAAFYRTLYESVGGGFRPITFSRGLSAMSPEAAPTGGVEIEPMPSLFACSPNDYPSPFSN